jgi:dolichol-phosphate mannosyltransferase
MKMSKFESARIISIIPVYHDSGNIRKVLEKFPNNIVDEICLIVDCATNEESDEIVETSRRITTPVHIVFNKERKGIGFAIRKGIKYAMENGGDIVVIMAGNNKDDPGEITRLLEPIQKEGYDYVQGSRFLPGGKRVKNPFLRSVFSRLYPFVWTLLTNIRCTDVTNGFRAYRLEIFRDKRINIWEDWLDNYELEYYVHYKVLTLGYRTKEVPVSKIYPYRHKGGYSKIAPFRDWWKIVGPLIYLKLGVRK